MALVGSVIVADMKYNHIYGGSPAKDLTDKLGAPFRKVTLEEKLAYMNERLREFYQLYPDFAKNNLKIAIHDEYEDDVTTFNIADRTYTKRGTIEEIEFMKFLLPNAKFIPIIK
jgi:hypothetical protein